MEKSNENEMKTEIFLSTERHICHLHISHKMPCLPPKFCKPFFKIFSGYYSGPKRD